MYILGITHTHTHTHTHTYTQQTNKCDRTYNPLLILCSAHTVRFAHTAQRYAVTQTIIVPVLLHLLHLLWYYASEQNENNNIMKNLHVVSSEQFCLYRCFQIRELMTSLESGTYT